MKKTWKTPDIVALKVAMTEKRSWYFGRRCPIFEES